MHAKRAHWATRLGFILAAAGSAIGLGNIWKFPYIAGVNGGGAFILVYLVVIALVGIPIFIAELYIGQASQKNAVDAFEALHHKHTKWKSIGFLGVLSAFLILSFYSVVGGWVLDFEFKSLFNQFSSYSDQEIKTFLGSLFHHPLRQIFWLFIFMAMTSGIVMKGIQNGIEKWNRILMPCLFLLLIFLCIKALTLTGFPKALSFLFAPDTSKLTARGILEAVGHSFFTLSLGMGAMITYGSYLSKKESLIRTAFTVAILDTVIALFAGIIIFSVVFTYQMEPGSGPTLMFQTLPVLFKKMTGGYWVSTVFFLLVTFAALTSAISLLEVVITYVVERWKTERKKTTVFVSTVIFLLGLLSVFSTNILSQFKIFGFTFFDLFDKITSNLFLPFGGLAISVFIGWIHPQAIDQITQHLSPRLKTFSRTALLWILKVIAPISIGAILINGILHF